MCADHWTCSTSQTIGCHGSGEPTNLATSLLSWPPPVDRSGRIAESRSSQPRVAMTLRTVWILWSVGGRKCRAGLQRCSGPRARRVASIWSGPFILAAAGLLNHRRVTTHWMFSELLAELYPSVQVDSNLIFARDGNIYTSGGITSGIDLALALVEEDRGREITLAVARTIVVFPRRPGGQSQFSAFLMAEAKNQPDIRELLGWILGHPGEDLSVSALADRMAMSPRNFARLFLSETGETPARFTERARSEAARCKLEQTVLPIETIAEQCGFGNTERMRRTFQRLFDISPQDYRARFRSTLLT